MDEETKQTVSRNPYAPPGAPVADPPLTEPRGPRPAQVTWAVRLFWVDLGLSVLQSSLNAYRDPDHRVLLSLLTDGLSGALLAFEAWVIVKISVGRNWARWVALASVMTAIPLSLGLLGQASLLDLTLESVSIAVDLVALSFLFLSSGRRWFMRPRNSTP